MTLINKTILFTICSPILIILFYTTTLTYAEKNVDSNPNAIYLASKFVVATEKVPNGILKTVKIPNSLNPFYVVRMNATERGYAHGQLFAETIINFVENELPLYYKEEIAVKLRWLAKMATKSYQSIGKGAGGEVAKIALGYILENTTKILGSIESKRI